MQIPQVVFTAIFIMLIMLAIVGPNNCQIKGLLYFFSTKNGSFIDILCHENKMAEAGWGVGVEEKPGFNHNSATNHFVV